MTDVLSTKDQFARIRRQAYPGEGEPRGMIVSDPPWTPRAMRDDVRTLLAEIDRLNAGGAPATRFLWKNGLPYRAEGARVLANYEDLVEALLSGSQVEPSSYRKALESIEAAYIDLDLQPAAHEMVRIARAALRGAVTTGDQHG